MKKITLCLMLIFVASMSWSQCTNGGAWQGDALANDGSFELQSSCNYTGEYSNTSNIIDGNDYRFLTSTGTDFITVTSSDGTIVYGFGSEPLLLTIDTSSDLNDQALRVYYHEDSTCATSFVCRATFVQNLTVATDVCPDPVNFGATAITDSSADLVWGEAGVSAVSYNVEVYASGESAANGDTPVFSDAAVTGFSVVASGLMESAAYDAYIMTTCSGATTMSNLVGPQSFTTASSCDDVADLIIENLSADQADISFTPGNGNDSFLVEVYASGENAANGDTPVYTNAAASSPETATGLLPETAYDAYVTGFCGATSTDVQGPVSFTTLTPPPANDDFANAIALNCGDNVTGSTNFATLDEDDAPDGFGADMDAPNVWFTYTGTGDIEDVTVDLCPSGYDTAVLIYTGTSGNLTLVAGNDDNSDCALAFRSNITFTSDGTSTYYIGVTGYNPTSIGDFDLTLTCEVACSPAQTNQDCAAAISAAVDGVAFTVDNTCATINAAQTTCDSFNSIADVWYTFTAPVTGAVDISSTLGTATAAHMSVYSGNCGALVSEDCSSTTTASLSLTTLIPGDTYYLQLWNNGSEEGTFDVTLTELCLAEAGTLTADADTVFLSSGTATISASEATAPTVPAGYTTAYVLTSGAGLVIEQTSATASFDVTATGGYTIHTLVYDPNTLDLATLPADATGFDVNDLLIQGGGDICGALDVTGAAVTVEDCEADAGTLTADASPVFLSDGAANISASEATAPTVPAGYTSLYVLTKGSSQVIKQTNATTASFDVTVAGAYTIHTLVYDPNTLDPATLPEGASASDVNALLLQGGGAICGALDVAGAIVSVGICTADAGTLATDASPVFLSGGTATVSATVGTAPIIPSGYTSLYVLTAGAGLVIEQTSATASFDVTATGDYRIHTLVYDPNTLDPAGLSPGATGFDVNALLLQGGGDICGALDVTGAAVTVEDCTAAAGTLTADSSSVFLAGGTATISASEATAPTVPTGYTTEYVLTSGTGLVIEQLGAAASFNVTSSGDYTIHTLVYDPNTLDPAGLSPGATGFDVNAVLIQGGGDICGALDVTGAAITVEDCTADAGTLTADESSVFLVGGTATISASEATAPTVPAGYTSLYVLTAGAGLVIEQSGATASFNVTSSGTYTIHTLVYDPNTLDPSTLPDGATGFDVNAALIQGGGDICGALDVAGAAVTVEDCEADAGTLTADASSVFLAGGTATVSASEATTPTVPAGYTTAYVLTSGTGLVIEQLGAAASFNVTSSGDYTIHTLVYDPTTLDPATLPVGATGFDVNAVLIQGGGAICGALDVAGAAVTVEDCEADAGTLTADASPVELVGGTATISASVATAPTVPAGYTTLYVLTAGSGLVIEQSGATASFDVTSVGNYTIHTLVYDPNTLDPSTLPVGATGFDVNALLIQGGGDICGALDVTGAAIIVEDVLGLNDLDKASFEYYPNPVQDALTLHAQNTIETVTMYNMLGQEVLRVTPNAIESTVNMSELQTGFYFVKVTISNVTQTIRVLKK